jgi:hypothetical protein
MTMYFALSNYMTRIVLVSLYINHRDLRFLLFYACNMNVAYPCLTTILYVFVNEKEKWICELLCLWLVMIVVVIKYEYVMIAEWA